MGIRGNVAVALRSSAKGSQASAFQVLVGAMISQDGAMQGNSESLRRALIRAAPTIR